MSLLSIVDDYLLIKRFSVYYWENYEFQDSSEIRNKFVVTLNCEVNEFPLTFVLPTSTENGNFYSQSKNRVDCVVINSGESEFFKYKDKKTIIDLKNIQEEDKEFIVAANSAGELIFKGILEKDLQERIIKAIEDSLTLEEYIIDKLLCR